MRLAIWLLMACAVACSGRRELVRRAPTAPEDAVVSYVDGGTPTPTVRPIVDDPNALLSVEPAHGPFSGGQLALLRGNGYSGEVAVWFNDRAVPAEDISVLDPNRVQVVVPPGVVGPADVKVQLLSEPETLRVLPGGYQYDAFFVEPPSGPTRGGTRIVLTGSGMNWSEDTRVEVDLEPCLLQDVRELGDGVQELECLTPPGTPGSKTVTVGAEPPGQDAGAASSVRVTGAFTYEDEGATLEGGLSGASLQRSLQVRVFDALFGEPAGGLSVILGRGETDSQRAYTDAEGVAAFEGQLGPAQTVTVAGQCIQPLTLVDVPVEQVALYVEPILTPECIPPSLEFPTISPGAGGAPSRRISGSLSWGTGVELKQTSWINVPNPEASDERQAAYVFELARDSRSTFRLPSAYEAVTTEERGTQGYPFEFSTRSATNLTLYALAGLERGTGSERRFFPYVMGVVRGVAPGDELAHPVITMNIILDQRLEFVVDAAEFSSGGPDRLELSVALRLGRSGFIPLPGTQKTALMPLPGPVTLQPLPPLAGALRDAQYVIQAVAVSGPERSLPVADLEGLATRSTSDAVSLSNFIRTPVLLQPEPERFWTELELEVEPPGLENFDLWVYRIESPSTALDWRVIAPRPASRVQLPDLRQFAGPYPDGATRILVSAARIPNFDYATLSQDAFGSAGWAAYSAQAFEVVSQLDP